MALSPPQDDSTPAGKLRTDARYGARLPGVEAELSGPDDTSSTRLFRAFLNAMWLHRQLMFKTLLAHGAHPGQVLCLRLLAGNDGISQRDLAQMLHVARPTVTRMLQVMEKAGSVARKPDPVDQRLTRVYLTPAGRDQERELSAVALEYVDQTIGTLPEADRCELTRLLDELADTFARVLAAAAEQSNEHEHPAAAGAHLACGEAGAAE